MKTEAKCEPKIDEPKITVSVVMRVWLTGEFKGSVDLGVDTLVAEDKGTFLLRLD